MNTHKLCPFCGGEPRYCTDENYGKFILGWIQCSKCYARILPRPVKDKLNMQIEINKPEDIWFMWDNRI